MQTELLDGHFGLLVEPEVVLIPLREDRAIDEGLFDCTAGLVLVPVITELALTIQTVDLSQPDEPTMTAVCPASMNRLRIFNQVALVENDDRADLRVESSHVALNPSQDEIVQIMLRVDRAVGIGAEGRRGRYT